MCCPRQIFQRDEEIISIIKAWNGCRDVYISVNRYHSMSKINPLKLDYTSISLRKCLFDFDGKPPISFAKYLERKHIGFAVNHSGRGNHIFIKIEDEGVHFDEKRLRLKQLMHDIGKGFDYDRATFGNIAQVYRLQGTMNLRTKKYCVPLTLEELYSQEFDASKPKKRTWYWNEGDAVPLQNFKLWEEISIDIGPGIFDIEDVTLPSCLQNVSDNRTRFKCIVFLQESGLTAAAVDNILKKMLSQDKYEHMRREKQIEKVFEGGYTFACDCDFTLRDMCPYRV